MKKIGLLLFCTIILLTQTSIENSPLDTKITYKEYNNKVILFLSLSNYFNEEKYYDAIIKLRRLDSPIDNNLVVFRQSKNPFEFFNLGIKKSPAILIITSSGNKFLEVKGTNVSTNEIVNSVLDAYTLGKIIQ
ncbi:hypothetical protein [Neobacillus vireti]|uniref:hypothetical protein n=1 Tax=Neobacillus vireti TaxID=220686 RepID=UPI0030004F4E